MISSLVLSVFVFRWDGQEAFSRGHLSRDPSGLNEGTVHLCLWSVFWVGEWQVQRTVFRVTF